MDRLIPLVHMLATSIRHENGAVAFSTVLLLHSVTLHAAVGRVI
jgi:hypothetical protein